MKPELRKTLEHYHAVVMPDGSVIHRGTTFPAPDPYTSPRWLVGEPGLAEHLAADPTASYVVRNLEAERQRRRCKTVISFDADQDDDCRCCPAGSARIACQLDTGHDGAHSHTGIEWGEAYTVTWERIIL